MHYCRLGFSEYVPLITGAYGNLTIDLEADAASFNASFMSAELGHVRASWIESNIGLAGERLKRSSQGKSEQLVLTLLEEGAYRISQYGNVAECRPLDLALLNASGPLQSLQSGSARVLAFSFPAEFLRAFLPRIDDACAIAVNSRCGVPAMLREIMTRVWSERESLTTGERNCLLGCLVRLIECTFAPKDSNSTQSALSHHLTRVRQIVDQQFYDPELSATQIAGILNISPGYVHATARTVGMTIGSLIFERRLQECRKLLSDPNTNSSITDVAYSSGFKSLPHFSRRFQERFGCSPREYRHKMQSEVLNHI